MGIKDFSKIFTPIKVTKFNKINETKKKITIAIDAMTELYRASLGASSVSTLTDKLGRPTMPINVMLYNIVAFHKNNIDQIWVFDYEHTDSDTEFHNKAKNEELAKRTARRDIEQKKLINEQQKLITEQITDNDEEVFYEISDELIKQVPLNTPTTTTQDKINQLEKRVFKVSKDLISSLKYILNCLNIKYVDAPKGFEGEQVAAYLSDTDQVDGVYSSDTDPIAFGAKYLYRKNPRDKLIYHYTRDDIFKQMKKANPKLKPNMEKLRQLCVAAGTDFAPKVPGLGAKTILVKFMDKISEFTTKQKEAVGHFAKEPETDINCHNLELTPFKNDKRTELIDWLVDERNFKRDRMEKLLLNV